MKKIFVFLICSVLSSVAVFGSDEFFDLSRLTLTEGISEYTLDNGLTVMIKEEHSVPLVGLAVSYNIGFRSENVDGKSGLTHLLEHMMFKGTEKYGKGQLNIIMDDIGAYNNAFTSYDKTVYWEIMPVAGLETAMDIESDRMINALLDPDEFASEKNVVLSELNNNESDPEIKLERELFEQVMGEHPLAYLYGTIEDMENAERDYVYNDLYKTYYCPNNAIVWVIGDINTDEALEMVESYFGIIESNPDFPAEQPIPIDFQTGVEVYVEGTASENFGEVLFDLPPYDLDDPDSVALLFLSDSGLVGGFGYWAVYDWGLGYVSFSDEPDYPAETLDKDFVREYFDEYKSQFFNQELLGYDSIRSIMMSLNSYQRDGHYSDYDKLMGLFAELTAEDVIDVIDKYLTKENSSVGYFTATEYDASAVAGSSSTEDTFTADYDFSELENPTDEAIAEAQTRYDEIYAGTLESMESYFSDVEEVTLDNGITVIFRPFGMSDKVSIMAGFDKAGSAYQTVANQADFTFDMVLGGGPQVQLLNDLSLEGASYYGSATFDYSYYHMEIKPEDFGNAMAAVEMALVDRAFIPLVLEEKKFVAVNALDLLENNPEPISHAPRILNQLIFGDAGAGLDSSDKSKDYLELTLQDIEDFYQTFYRPENMTIVVVGNIEHDEVISLIEEHLGGWEQAEPVMEIIQPELIAPKREIIKTISLDSYQSIVMMGAPSVDYTDTTNYLGFQLANHIFGGSGLTSRLMRVIRDEEGLTYGVYSYAYPYGDVNMFRMYMQNDPANVERAIELFQSELARFKQYGPSELEILKFKTMLMNTIIFDFETADSISSSLLYYKIKRGSYDFLIDYLKIMDSIDSADLTEIIQNSFPDDMYIIIAGE